MSAYSKNCFKTIKNNISRFFAILFIMLLGSMFLTGVGGISKHVNYSFSNYLNENRIQDIDIKFANEEGMETDSNKFEMFYEKNDDGTYSENVSKTLTDSYYFDFASVIEFDGKSSVYQDQKMKFRLNMFDDFLNKQVNVPYVIEKADDVKPEENKYYYVKNSTKIVKSLLDLLDEVLKNKTLYLGLPVYVEQSSETLLPFKLGDMIQIGPIVNSFNNMEINIYLDLYIQGIVSTPNNFGKSGEVDFIDNESLQGQIYLSKTDFTSEVLQKNSSYKVIYDAKFDVSSMLSFPTTDLYLAYKDKKVDTDLFGNEYSNRVEKSIESIKTDFYTPYLEENPNFGFTTEDYEFLDVESLKCYSVLDTVTSKIDVIALIFPNFFALVVSLVSLTTMTRLIDEERSQIGTYKSLGVNNSKITMKYVIFALISSLIGLLIGAFSGVFLLPKSVYVAFENVFFLPKEMLTIHFNFGFIFSILILFCVLFVTIYVANKAVKERVTDLMKVKAPKPGKKVFLEKIPFIWNHMKFKYKSTWRNIFRYVGRFFMIVIATAGSSALILGGFGLLNSSEVDLTIKNITINLSDTLVPVSVLVIIFALCLMFLVVYNLTNMDIGERTREIATLEVLGYKKSEVCLYIYREIFIMAFIGCLVGLPLGVGLLSVVFYYLGFSSLENVHWWSYFVTIGLSMLFVILADLVMIPKINKIDMNDALKSLE